MITEQDIIRGVLNDTAPGAAIDELGQLYLINDKFCEEVGWEIETLKSVGLTGLLNPKSFELIMDQIHNTQPWVGHLSFFTQKGGANALDFKLHKFIVKTKHFAYMALRRKNGLQALREEQNKLLSSISSNLKDGMYRTNQAGEFLYVNKGILDLFGFDSEEEVLSLEAEEFYVDPTQRTRLMDSLETQPYLKNLEVMFKKKNGEVFWGLVSTTKTLSYDGKVLYDGSIRDISSIKEMERLLRSEKQKALAASKSKEEFLSIVSHELKTPLNAVVGMANVLIQNEPRKDQLESLNVMTFSANSLLSLINDILDFSKIKMGKIDLELRDTDFRVLMKNIISGFQELIKPKALTMRLEVSDDIPQELILDSSRLNQVLNNLIGNACKFTFHGEIAVVVTKISGSKNKVVLLFEVMDTGVGIPDQKKDLIFESFSQVSSTNTREYGGTGLGLSISKQLVGLMGGKLEVKSEVGFGSNFHFELELAVSEASSSSSCDARNDIDPELLKLKGAKILAVEDNEVNQVLLQRYAEMWGVNMVMKSNGLEAVAAIESGEEYDLVLMDIQMPIMDGYTSAERIRKNPKLNGLPIIAVTATSTDDVRSKVFICGMNDFVSKPYSPDVLKKVIASHLS